MMTGVVNSRVPVGFRFELHTWTCPELYALKAVSLHREAAEFALAADPELFSPGAERAVAALILTGNRIPLESLRGTERERAEELLAVIRRCDVPADVKFAMHIMRVQAERRSAPIVAATFRWAAERIEADTPFKWVIKKVNEAVQVTGSGGIEE